VHPILVFDGDCGICSASVGFLRRAGCTARMVTSQEWTASHPEDTARVAEAVVVVTPDGRRLEAQLGVAEALRLSSRPWPAIGAVIAAPGIRVVAGWVYRLVARNRTRLSSMVGLNACALPDRDV
jgi:predicted DCC family thiol-disulfide oxidoreductase YuxK